MRRSSVARGGRTACRWARPIGVVATLLWAVLALPVAGHAQHGLPSRIVADQRVGDYRVSLWAAPDVGMGRVYVVYDAVGEGPFVPPSVVLVGITPVSGRLPEKFYHAHAERVRTGARFVAHVDFDREEEWRIRVVTTPPVGGAELVAQVRATPIGGLGPLGLALYSLPFLAVILLRWRAGTVARRHPAPRRPALVSP